MNGERHLIRGPLTAELDDTTSPVRRFLSERFTNGLRDLQRRYREAAPALVVPAAARQEANPGTVGTAADWLLRFMLHPRPSLRLAAEGAALSALRAVGPRNGLPGTFAEGPDIALVPALTEIAGSLGMGRDVMGSLGEAGFIGPVGGNGADPEHLARVCWVLALLTEVYRAGPITAVAGPLGQFRGRRPSADELLALAPPAAVSQLTAFRHAFETALLPQLANRPGRWFLGPEFDGSALLKADADLIAAGLLLDLKTHSKLTLSIKDVLQVIGYALLDFDDTYRLTELGIFSARYAYLTTWDIGVLLDELAGCQVSLSDTRQEFRQLLLHQNLPR